MNNLKYILLGCSFFAAVLKYRWILFSEKPSAAKYLQELRLFTAVLVNTCVFLCPPLELPPSSNATTILLLYCREKLRKTIKYLGLEGVSHCRVWTIKGHLALVEQCVSFEGAEVTFVVSLAFLTSH